MAMTTVGASSRMSPGIMSLDGPPVAHGRKSRGGVAAIAQAHANSIRFAAGTGGAASCVAMSATIGSTTDESRRDSAKRCKGEFLIVTAHVLRAVLFGTGLLVFG